MYTVKHKAIKHKKIIEFRSINNINSFCHQSRKHVHVYQT